MINKYCKDLSVKTLRVVYSSVLHKILAGLSSGPDNCAASWWIEHDLAAYPFPTFDKYSSQQLLPSSRDGILSHTDEQDTWSPLSFGPTFLNHDELNMVGANPSPTLDKYCRVNYFFNKFLVSQAARQILALDKLSLVGANPFPTFSKYCSLNNFVNTFRWYFRSYWIWDT
jgi:hypothetical protein